MDVASYAFSNEVRILIEEHRANNKRVALDKVMIQGLRALEAQGFDGMWGEKVTEKSRLSKGPDEILATRCDPHACDISAAEIGKAASERVPKGNISEDGIQAVLHAENICRGVEWIETRLLASGPRTKLRF